MATLSADPTGAELEDYVAAHLAARGMYVETGVTERDPKDILELDVVWTDYQAGNATRFPAEVKSGDWGLGDLFKFFGWTRYLALERGCFICRNLPTRVDGDSIKRLADRIGISIIHIPEPQNSDSSFASLGLPAPPSKHLPELWRYSFWVQRRLLRSLPLAISTRLAPECAKAAKEYFRLINDATFFEPDVRARVSILLEAHRKHPSLGRTMAAELSGKGVNFETPPDTDLFKKSLYYGSSFPIQTCLLLAHRGRLAIIKAAVDYVIAKRQNQLPKKIVKIFDHDWDVGDLGLYKAFLRAIEAIEGAPSFQRYAIFWQIFILQWGGFLLLDRKDDEYRALSVQTGVPIDEIDSALKVFEMLFPLPGGWFSTPAGASRKVLKLTPAALRGVGAYSRLARHDAADYDKLGYRDRTSVHLAQDHNTVVRLLDGGDGELTK